jgi:hypothetical protein
VDFCVAIQAYLSILDAGLSHCAEAALAEVVGRSTRTSTGELCEDIVSSQMTAGLSVWLLQTPFGSIRAAFPRASRGRSTVKIPSCKVAFTLVVATSAGRSTVRKI